MSEDAKPVPGADEHLPPIPVTSGVSRGVRILILAGLAVVFMQGSFVVISSGFGRVWPAADSAKIDLTPSAR